MKTTYEKLEAAQAEAAVGGFRPAYDFSQNPTPSVDTKHTWWCSMVRMRNKTWAPLTRVSWLPNYLQTVARSKEASTSLLQHFAQLTKTDVALNNLVKRAKRLVSNTVGIDV